MGNTTTAGKQTSVYRKAIEGYKESLKTKPYLAFKSYCRDNNIAYEKILDWTNRQGIFVRDLKGEARGEELSHGDNQQTFIQFRPQARPGIAGGMLKGVSITFPDNINLSLQECTTESLISLLSMYHPQK